MGNLLQGHFSPLMAGGMAVIVVLVLWYLMTGQSVPAERLKSVTERRNQLQEQQKKESSRLSAKRIGLMKQVVEGFKLARGKSFDDMRLRLARAGYRTRDTIFVFLFCKLAFMGCLSLTAAFFIFVLHAAKLQPALGLLVVAVAGAIGWFLPDIIVKNQTQKRTDILRKALPDALDLMVICAEAGLSMDASFDRVSREMAQSCPLLAEEIGLTSVELNFFPERARALQGLSDRIALPGVLALVNTLIQTEKYGTPLAQALRVLSAEMREERIMKAEEKAARLPAILTVPMIVFILPPLFVVLIGPAAIKVVAAMHGGH